jgi:hypothetical protein
MSINQLIQSKLIEKDLDRIQVIIANQWTNEAGILKDDLNRPGRPLRRKCRNNEIHGAVKENGLWYIYRVGFHEQEPNTTLATEVYVHEEINYIEDIGQYEVYFSSILNRTILYNLQNNDPVNLLVKARIAGEHISRLIASKECGDIYNDDMKLFEVVSLLSDNGVISDLAKNIIHSLRVYGNIALHNPTDLLGHEDSIAWVVCGSLKLYMDILSDNGKLDGLM